MVEDIYDHMRFAKMGKTRLRPSQTRFPVGRGSERVLCIRPSWCI